MNEVKMKNILQKIVKFISWQHQATKSHIRVKKFLNKRWNEFIIIQIESVSDKEWDEKTGWI